MYSTYRNWVVSPLKMILHHSPFIGVIALIVLLMAIGMLGKY